MPKKFPCNSTLSIKKKKTLPKKGAVVTNLFRAHRGQWARLFVGKANSHEAATNEEFVGFAGVAIGYIGTNLFGIVK